MAAAEAMAAGKFCSGELLFRATYPDGAAQRVLPEALREWLWNSLVCGDHHATLLVRPSRASSLSVRPNLRLLETCVLLSLIHI